ncbi:MAG: TonB-dependent receptor [Ignavibacteriales bacterium]|nr:TonB-dependent receptor [Ignavibacteriales bacterium]MCF8316240.1 TonB-dependent receptor [Ignavibacteriales bacterium]MCF8437824.1 TonB-dependent receptor [Ignavibacteriales bacterium]
MKIFMTLLLGILLPVSFSGQEFFRGKVYSLENSENFRPLPGANIIWLGTDSGTSTDIFGNFELLKNSSSNKLIISFTGYKSDTLIITNQNYIEVKLLSEVFEVKDVEVTGKQSGIALDYFGTENTSKVTTKELQKAACCNLSESFETNPSVDVSFTDALTGVKQIEMLGLSGTYTQLTMENLPYLRGLMSNTGLGFMPGPWMNSINISKGVGSVANGFESITGQIDIDVNEPFDINGKPLYLNFYGDRDQRYEGNLNYRFNFGEHLAGITLFHSSRRQHEFDLNSDNFIDMPRINNLNFMQRFHFVTDSGWESQVGIQFLRDEKRGGTISNGGVSASDYSYGSDIDFINLFTKTGFVFPDHPERSFGVQLSYTGYRNSSQFGLRNYLGRQNSAYLNFIYQDMLIEGRLKYRAGFSFLYDNYDEAFSGMNFARVERIPGVFLETTFTPDEKITAVVGLRLDRHNFFGAFLTPRLHLRYAPDPDLVFRLTAGKGIRTPNILTENSSSFASSRNIFIRSDNTYGTGLPQESAWNFGLSTIYYFLYDWREATFSIDFHRTQFTRITIADLDQNPRAVNFYSVDDGAYSNSVQTELNIEPFESFSTRIAYRFLDVRQNYQSGWKSKPFISGHRILFNAGYSSERISPDDAQMLYDLTVQWFGSKRIPSTVSNPADFRIQESSPSFFIVNAQITRSFFENFDIYLGVENLFDFRQTDAIIDHENPESSYFDASMIWGPLNGRMLYSGLRYRI